MHEGNRHTTGPVVGKVVALSEAILNAKLALAFKIAYVCLAFLSWNFVTADTGVLPVLSTALVLFGAVLLLARLVCFRRFVLTTGLMILVLFACSFILSSLMNVQYGFVGNLQGFAWLTLELFALYAFDSRVSKETVESHVTIFCLVLVVLSFLMSAVSVVMAYIGYTYVGSIAYLGSVVGGMFDGRLFGLYSDPNLGAVCSWVSCLISITWLLSRKLSACQKTLLIINIVAEVFYIGLSASRTALISCAASAFLFVLALSLLRKEGAQNLANVFLALGKALLAAAVSVACVMGSVAVYEKTYPTVFSAIGGPVSSEKELYLQALNSSESFDEGYFSDEGLASGEAEPSKEAEASFGVGGRETGGDISTGRFAIWSAAFEVWETSPVWGVTHRNLSTYVNEAMPGSFFTQPWSSYTTMHNVFMDTLVAQGAIGVILILAFIVVAGRASVRGFRCIAASRLPLYCCMLASLVAIGASALFYSEILYINTIGSVVFWSFLGTALSLAAPEQSES